MRLVELLFPLKCILCDEPVPKNKTAVCPECAEAFKEMISQRCDKCGLETCECECYPTKGIDKKYFLLWYKEKPIKKLIYLIKRNADIRQVDFLAEMISLKIRLHSKAERTELLDFSCICSVPRSKKAVAEYGYNQSELIAKKLSASLGVPYIDLLERAKNSQEQKSLSGELRSKNTKGIFSLSKTALNIKSEIDKKGVLIADDVTTSGSTLAECASILIAYGFKKVDAALIAQTVRSK